MLKAQHHIFQGNLILNPPEQVLVGTFIYLRMCFFKRPTFIPLVLRLPMRTQPVLVDRSPIYILCCLFRRSFL